MAFPSSYNFAMFQTHGRTHYRNEYSTATSAYLYTCKFKSYYDDLGQLQSARMLRVGHCFYKLDGPPVWAVSDGTRVYYYYGREGLLTFLKHELGNKVYFTAPASFLSGAQDATGMTPARKLGQQAVEIFIHYFFLRIGTIKFVRNDRRKDMLRIFEHACTTFEQNREEELQAQRIKLEHEEDDEPEEVSTLDVEQNLPVRAAKRRRMKVEQPSDKEYVPDRQIPAADAILPYDASSRPDLHLRLSLVEHIQAYENQMHAGLTQQKTELEEKVKNLETELETQKGKSETNDAFIKAEKKKRKIAEAYGEEMKDKCQEHENASVARQKVCAEEKDRTHKWKKKAEALETKYKSLKKKLKGLMDD